MRPLLLLAAMTLIALPARAQDCPAEPAILALSDMVLAERAALPRLKARGAGAEAAYLKIRYGRLPADKALDLARGLRADGVREAADLAGALEATHGGLDAVAASTGNPAEIGTLVSTLRAVLLYGDGEKLLAALAGLPAERRETASPRIVAAVIDRPDAEKAALAEAAGRHGLPLLQAGLIATQESADAWTVFAENHPDRDRLADLTRLWSWAPALVGRPALPAVAAVEPDVALLRESFHAAQIAAARQPERDFLMTYVNQTGDTAAAAKAGAALAAAIDDGTVRSRGTLDAAWLVVYRALRGAVDNVPAMDGTLDIVTFTSARYPQASGGISVRAVIDRLLAVEALSPYLRGEAGTLPAMPAEFGAPFRAEWPLWTEVAQALKGAPLAAFAKDPARAAMAAELLHAAGESGRLADLVLSVADTETKIALATDFSMRLDRGCASHFHHRGEAVLLAGQPIFRFDPAK